VHVAQVLKELFEHHRQAADATSLLEQAVVHLTALPSVVRVAILVQQSQAPFRVRARAGHGLPADAVKSLGEHAPRGSGRVRAAWPAQLLPAELSADAHYCAVPLSASPEQVTLVCDGPADLETLSLVATFLALALERDQALSDASRLGELFVAGPVVVIRWRNEEGWPVEYVSPNVTKEFGYPLDQVLEKPYATRVYPADLVRVRTEVTEAITRGVSYFAQQYRLVDATGQARDVYDFTHVIRDAAGAVTHFHGYVFDDGERTRAERAEAGLVVQLQQSQKLQAVGTMASGIAHDFNNVLAAILAHLELARLDPAITRNTDLVAATQAALRGRDIVRQLLVFGRSRVEERLPSRLQRIIEDSMGMMRSTIPSTIGLRLALDPKTPPVLADPIQLQQVLVNLVTNAAHSMPQGGTVEISLTTRPGTPPHAELSVKDAGEGMTREVLDRAFEPFFTTKPVGKGTGLGLSMAHTIISAHGGTVDLKSTPGVGTTVVLSLPAVSNGGDAGPAKAKAASAPGKQQRIALVDDEPLVARAAERLIAHFGYAVTPMTSAKQVLDAFAENPDAFELVLTDQTMPEMTGLQLAQALRARGVKVPVLLVTGLPTEINGVAATIGPPFTVLGKPYRAEELAAALSALLTPSR
jgi:signal transduction histidine kinase/ActR/RegA family two-component response regulator